MFTVKSKANGKNSINLDLFMYLWLYRGNAQKAPNIKCYIITIPKAYFKSILLRDSSSVNFRVFYALKNGDVKEKFTTINRIEKQLGIDLFQCLPDSLENKLVTKDEMFKLLK